MKAVGILHKMKTKQAKPCDYSLPVGEQLVPMNEFLGHSLEIEHTGLIYCIQCGRKTNKSFQQGYCYPCFQRLQECGCQVKPENCKFYEGNCQPDDWAHVQCGQPHIVYLANSSGLKVGITQCRNIPSRWLDQGASQALPFVKTNNRYLAGLVEVACKDFVADKTNWRAMLKGEPEAIDLVAQRDSLMGKISEAIERLDSEYPGEIETIEEAIQYFSYPILKYPTKINTYNLDKQASFNDELIAIKGQYLIFSNGVINIRKFGGYEVILRG